MDLPIETCREWMPSRHDNCKAPADFVLWGKLFPKEALGPRCQDHAVRHVPHLLGRVDQYAVLDLRKLTRLAVASCGATATEGDQTDG